jgi:hypothetical protein
LQYLYSCSVILLYLAALPPDLSEGGILHKKYTLLLENPFLYLYLPYNQHYFMSSLSFSEMFIMALIILAKVAFWGAIAYGAYKLYHRMNKSA